MNANPVLWVQAYIIGVLIFLISITAGLIKLGIERARKCCQPRSR
jgi:hypothetical protein